jgi:NAD(P)H-quinone oxidoreductase subunit 5
VDLTRRLALSAGPDRWRWLVAWTVPTAVTIVAIWLTGLEGPWSLWLLLAAAASVVLAERDSRSHRETLGAALVLAALLVGAYAVQKLATGQLIAPVAASAGWLGNAWIVLLVAALAGTYVFLRICPDHPLARRASGWLYAGLYLDEWVTRTTLQIWPIRLPIRLQPKTLSLLTEETVR